MKLDPAIAASITLSAPQAGPAEPSLLKARRAELPAVAMRRPQPIRTNSLCLVPETSAAAESPRAVWEPTEPGPSTRVTSSQVIHDANHATTSLSSAAEARLIELITGPVPPEAGHQQAGAIREARLCAFIGALGALDGYHLDRRLRRDADDDPLVVAFRRLIPARRRRIIEQLERARRARRARPGSPGSR